MKWLFYNPTLFMQPTVVSFQKLLIYRVPVCTLWYSEHVSKYGWIREHVGLSRDARGQSFYCSLLNLSLALAPPGTCKEKILQDFF